MATQEPNPTPTQTQQWTVEAHVFRIYNQFSDLPRRPQQLMLELVRDKHAEYLTNGLRRLPPSFCVLDANRPWLCYWIVHSLALLGESMDPELEDDVVGFLSRCQDPNGGYAGGPGQMPHLATTYAAVNSLITLGGHKALSSLNRDKVYAFLRRMKDPSGCFRMHDQGELDVRACYTAISVASILNVLDYDLAENVGNYILSCQTYEGGIAGEPGSEAHGGYTFCGLAAMILINEAHRLDLPALTNWVVFRQGVEGGFQGRTNKLVDGCYSFWQGGVFPLIQRLQHVVKEHLETTGDKQQDASLDGQFDSSKGEDRNHMGQEGPHSAPNVTKLSDVGLDFLKRPVNMGSLLHSFALQQYIILCSQVIDGGLRDKPGKARDFYHTCYCLSGLSVCQYIGVKDNESSPLPEEVIGPFSNLLERIHPLYNVIIDRYYEACEFFSSI